VVGGLVLFLFPIPEFVFMRPKRTQGKGARDVRVGAQRCCRTRETQSSPGDGCGGIRQDLEGLEGAILEGGEGFLEHTG